jgi:hypothetical protein
VGGNITVNNGGTVNVDVSNAPTGPHNWGVIGCAGTFNGKFGQVNCGSLNFMYVPTALDIVKYS